MSGRRFCKNGDNTDDVNFFLSHKVVATIYCNKFCYGYVMCGKKCAVPHSTEDGDLVFPYNAAFHVH